MKKTRHAILTFWHGNNKKKCEYPSRVFNNQNQIKFLSSYYEDEENNEINNYEKDSKQRIIIKIMACWYIINKKNPDKINSQFKWKMINKVKILYDESNDDQEIIKC